MTKKKWKRRAVIIVLISLALGLGALTGWMLSGWARGGSTPTAMTGDCIKAGCHDVASKEAKIHVAADQKELPPDVPLVVVAGSSVELDFYFEDMLGERQNLPVVGALLSAEPYRAVGMELVVDADWKVDLGTEARPAGWSAAWQRGGSGYGEWESTRWLPTDDAAGRYYLDFRNSSWRVYSDLPALAADAGNQSAADLDGVAGKMGADATVRVPPDTPSGQYEIVVAGVGHDGEGRRAYVAQTITVEVMPADYAEPAPALPDGAWLYTALCSSCHVDTPEGRGKLLRRGPDRVSWVINWGTGDMRPIRGLDKDEVGALVAYIQEGAVVDVLIPYVPHLVEGQSCLSCHGAGALRPFPPYHVGFAEDKCTGCHRVSPAVAAAGIPQVPHPGEGRACLECHDAGGLIPMPATHGGWGEEICLVCHEVVPEMVGVVTPDLPHRASPGTVCSSCHGFDGVRPMPQDHKGREDRVCVACHNVDQRIVATIPLMPHTAEGREACLACHSPAGWKPAPADHWDRTEETCVVCHRE